MTADGHAATLDCEGPDRNGLILVRLRCGGVLTYREEELAPSPAFRCEHDAQRSAGFETVRSVATDREAGVSFDAQRSAGPALIRVRVHGDYSSARTPDPSRYGDTPLVECTAPVDRETTLAIPEPGGVLLRVRRIEIAPIGGSHAGQYREGLRGVVRDVREAQDQLDRSADAEHGGPASRARLDPLAVDVQGQRDRGGVALPGVPQEVSARRRELLEQLAAFPRPSLVSAVRELGALLASIHEDTAKR